MKKVRLAILFFLSVSVLFSCTKKFGAGKSLPEGSVIHLFENESKNPNQEPAKDKEYKIGDWTFSFEKIDKDQYEVEKVKQKFPKSLKQTDLPDSITSRVGIGENGLMKSIWFRNGTIKYFPVKKDDESQEYHFYAFYPQLNMISVSSNYAENYDITSYNMKDGKESDISPEDYNPDASACFTIREDSNSLSAIFIDVKKQKKVATFMLDDIESGYSSDAYETAWIDSNTVLLKVEANDQDEDEYWILKIKR